MTDKQFALIFCVFLVAFISMSTLTTAWSTLTTAWMLGCVSGFFLGVTAAGRRRPTCKELMSGGNLGVQALSLNEGRTQRGYGNGAPATPKPNIIPKPQFPPPRTIREDFLP